MSRIAFRARAVVLALATAAALGFGARTALARPASGCADPTANGACDTATYCDKFCLITVGHRGSTCANGCCYCWFEPI